jgi:hypothetical protein
MSNKRSGNGTSSETTKKAKTQQEPNEDEEMEKMLQEESEEEDQRKKWSRSPLIVPNALQDAVSKLSLVTLATNCI